MYMSIIEIYKGKDNEVHYQLPEWKQISNYCDPSAECILFNDESNWLYSQSNISMLQVDMKQVPGEISKIIQAKSGVLV